MQLTAPIVLAIFAHRPESREHVGPSAVTLGRWFNVTEKTVRDIWRGRTWSAVTGALDRKPYCARRGRPRAHRWIDAVFAE